MALSLKISSLLSLLVIALTGAATNSQTSVAPLQELQRGVGDTSIFAPLDVTPAPSVYRSASGAPGPHYWQNRADYDLHATLDTGTHSVRGAMTLRYTNHSPDTLTFLWFQTEQNIFRANSLSLVIPDKSQFVDSAVSDGDVIDRFVQTNGHTTVPLTLRDHGTITQVVLAHALAPGQTTTLEVTWHFTVPRHGADRMGRDGTLYEIAQWYPRLCVYDDVRGWNTDPYLGLGEFYLEYGNFTLSVTVPTGYVVAATGTLDNARDVLTARELTRLHAAKTATTPVAIITPADFVPRAARHPATGTYTWRFHAANVRDAVWAAAPDYQWDAVTWHGILAQSFYRPAAVPVWGNGEGADETRASIQEYSERWFPYPYPQASAVEGPVGGMEYPMLAMEGAQTDFETLTHEVGHNWFPMIVGSNERLHAWMDEGFNNFINNFSQGRRLPKEGDQWHFANEERERVERALQRGTKDVPIEMPADRFSEGTLGLREYTKTSTGLQLLRQDILGPATFDDAFRTYIRRWAYKHPTPADFFRTMENVAGRRLDWFWREWFYETPRFDQSLDTVATRMVGDTERVAVRYGNRARGVLPILVRFTLTDGTTQDSVYPAEVWSINSTRYVRHYAFIGKRLRRIDLDPDHHLIDVDRTNNSWIATRALGEVQVPLRPGDSTIQRIYEEGMQHSQGAALAQVLMDSIGPRLTGSPANRAANDWLARTYTGWGISVHEEPYGTWRSWTRGPTHVDLMTPRVRTLEATALAWSPATPAGGITGDVVALPPTRETHDSAGFAHWLTTVRGKFVLLSPPPVSCRPDTSWATFALPATYQAMRAARDSLRAEWRSRAAVAGKGPSLVRLLDDAGVAGILTTSWYGRWGVAYVMDTRATVAPAIEVGCEDYTLLARLAEHAQHPTLHATVETHVAPAELPVANTIAELHGTTYPDQYVILSAHVDSWDASSGATDNGVGTIVMLEAMRLLKKFYPHPKRTILVGHWSGEEEGEIGSNRFAQAHPDILRGLQAVLNEDDGMGRIDHILTSGFLDAHAAFTRWMATIPSSLTTGITVDDPGKVQVDGSDEDAFTCRNAPGFLLDQVDWDDDYTYHNNRDTFDKLVADEIARNATLIAMLAYNASEDPQRISRARRDTDQRPPACFPAPASWAASHDNHP